MNRTATIFVIDDEPLVRRALRQSLESLGARVVSFEDGHMCLAAMAEQRCDLVISDVNMPAMDGVTLLKKVKELSPLTPVLMMTGYGSIPLAVRCIQAGACDFIEKPLDEAVLLPKVDALLKRDKGMTNEHELTSAERQIVELVAEGKSNKEIAFLVNRSIRTVENHRHRIMKKLGLSSTAELVRFVLSKK
jgi:FixJ family two-component response regulator